MVQQGNHRLITQRGGNQSGTTCGAEQILRTPAIIAVINWLMSSLAAGSYPRDAAFGFVDRK
ncbi:hypothetical protein ACULNC_02065 [Shigella flexneri]